MTNNCTFGNTRNLKFRYSRLGRPVTFSSDFVGQRQTKQMKVITVILNDRRLGVKELESLDESGSDDVLNENILIKLACVSADINFFLETMCSRLLFSPFIKFAFVQLTQAK